ncbi:hypothetical protein ACWEQ4_01020 [Rhodococcus sp. NPDC003994]
MTAGFVVEDEPDLDYERPDARRRRETALSKLADASGDLADFLAEVDHFRSLELGHPAIAEHLGYEWDAYTVKLRRAGRSTTPDDSIRDARIRAMFEDNVASGEPFTLDRFPMPDDEMLLSRLVNDAVRHKQIRRVGKVPGLGRSGTSLYVGTANADQHDQGAA